MRAATTLIALLALAAPAHAATFTTERLSDGRVAIHMRGVIERGDEVKAAAARRAAPTASLLLLDSPGGDAWTSLELGRSNPLPTEVRTGEVCISGCATVWVTARERYIEPGASVGFHQISQMVDGHPVPVPWATAIVADWYRHLGFSAEAIQVMTMASPSDIHWVSNLDAAQGIAFAPRATTHGTPIVTADSATRAPAPKPFSWLKLDALPDDPAR